MTWGLPYDPGCESSKTEGYRLVRIPYPKNCHVILVVSDDCILGWGKTVTSQAMPTWKTVKNELLRVSLTAQNES